MLALGFNIFSPLFWIRLVFRLGTVAVLLLNAVYILSEERFLARIGWRVPSGPEAWGVEELRSGPARLKNTAIEVVNWTRWPARACLVVLNIIYGFVWLLFVFE